MRYTCIINQCFLNTALHFNPAFTRFGEPESNLINIVACLNLFHVVFFRESFLIFEHLLKSLQLLGTVFCKSFPFKLCQMFKKFVGNHATDFKRVKEGKLVIKDKRDRVFVSLNFVSVHQMCEICIKKDWVNCLQIQMVESAQDH